MSVAVLILSIILELLGFLTSPLGIAVFLMGLVLFLALPAVPLLTGQFKRFAHFHIWLATSLISRMAIVVTEHGDLLMKSMEFDDLGVEKISFNDDDKSFEDPAGALHHFFGIKFALADEKHGVLFDPRHAALGARKHEVTERGEKDYRATQDEYNTYNVHEWKRGVFEFAKNAHELVSLGHMRQLIDGGERAEFPQRTESFYEISREPYKSSASTVRVMMILLALMAPFGMVWFVWNQTTGSAGGSTVGYDIAYAALLAIPSLATLGDVLEDVDWQRGLTAAGVLLTLPLIFLVLVIVAGPITAVTTFGALTLGFWTIPLLTFPLRVTSSVGPGLGKQLFKTGLKGFNRPVFKWTPRKYTLVEGDDLDVDEQQDVTWYGLLGNIIGFTYEPSAESWGPAVEPHDELENRKEHTADGQTALADGSGNSSGVAETNLPSKYVRAPGMRRASVYAAFLPKQLRRRKLYVHSGIAWGEFSDSATGEKSMNRLTQAKEVHGGDSSMSDKTLIYATVGCGLFSFISGIAFFFVL